MINTHPVSGKPGLAPFLVMRNLFSTSDRGGRRTATIVALSLLGSAFAVLVVVPGLQDWAAALVIAAISMFVSALALAIRDAKHARRFAMKNVLSVTAAFTIGALVAVGVVNASQPKEDMPQTLATQVEAAPSSGSAMPTIVTVSAATNDTVSKSFVDTQAALRDVKGDRAQAMIKSVKALAYEPASGRAQDFSKATVQNIGGTTVVSVPLAATNLPELTKVAYVSIDGVVHVTEMVSEVLDASHASVMMWEDGELTKDVVLYDKSATASSVQQVGLSWTLLNRCLASQGISGWTMAILGVVCGAACATAVLCIPCLAAAAGVGAGTVAACVRIAWK